MPQTDGVAEAMFCGPVSLPEATLQEAAQTAVQENPANAPGVGARLVLSPQDIAFITSKWWGAAGVKLSVGILGRSQSGLLDKILEYANRWGEDGNVLFSPAADASRADVRISLGQGGYWSYLGTDIRHIPSGRPTMNLERFSLATPDAEYSRVVVHEFGHTAGCPHEHARPWIVRLLDRAKTIAYMRKAYGWDEQTTVQQVLTPLDEADLTGSWEDPESIMTYSFPGECTISGEPILGGTKLTDLDRWTVAAVYPKEVLA